MKKNTLRLQIELPIELNKKLKIYKIKKEFSSIDKAALSILKEHLEGEI